MDEKTTIELLAALVSEANRIATALEIITAAQVPAPNYKRTLAAYADFDWSAIGARVVETDAHGPARVEWNGRIFARRNSADKKKGAAIWYSCVVSGTVAEGNCKWARLISFKDPTSEPEPLDEKISQAQTRPAPTSKAPAAATDPADARKKFYELSGEAIHAGNLAAQQVNDLVRNANGNGFAAALVELQKLLEKNR